NYGSGSGDPGAKIPFSLNKYGFTVCLSSNVPLMPAETISSIAYSGTTATVTTISVALAGGVAGGYQEQEIYGASPPSMAVGLVTTSTGESDFVLLVSANFGQAVNGVYPGAANSLAYVSPVVMTELHSIR